MIWLAGGALALSALAVATLSASLRWQNRAHERERNQWQVRQDTLVNQLCNLVGKPWTLPRDEANVIPFLSDPDEKLALIGDPDQLPDWEE